MGAADHPRVLLGPLRFSELARAVGGAPTDVLTKRLRDLERDGIVGRRELAPPASAVVYELTEFGRGLELPMLELARWGIGLQCIEDVVGLEPSSLANGLRVILRPPADFTLTLALHSGGQSTCCASSTAGSPLREARPLRPT